MNSSSGVESNEKPSHLSIPIKLLYISQQNTTGNHRYDVKYGKSIGVHGNAPGMMPTGDLHLLVLAKKPVSLIE